MLKSLSCLFLFIALASCINTKTQKTKDFLSGEIVSICEDSILTQGLDGKWYKNLVLKFKIKNNSNRIYYTRLFDQDSSFACMHYTGYYSGGDSVSSKDLICFGYFKDSILPNESKIYYHKIIPHDSVIKVRNGYSFYSEDGDTANKYKVVPIIFDLTKMINCNSSVLNSSTK